MCRTPPGIPTEPRTPPWRAGTESGQDAGGAHIGHMGATKDTARRRSTQMIRSEPTVVAASLKQVLTGAGTR